jgi:hypothetical protein
LVHKVPFASRVKGDKGLWFFTSYSSRADLKVQFVRYPSQADLKIHYVRYAHLAGWRKGKGKTSRK